MDAYQTQIPDGEYEVAFRKAEKFRFLGRRWVWAIHMTVMSEGEHFGKPILFFLSALPKGKRPTPGWRIASAYEKATRLRPPKHLARYKPDDFMEGCTFLACVFQGTKDSDGVERPDGARYSKVKFLIRRLSGTPPCIRLREA